MAAKGSVNKVHLLGRIGHNPQIKHTPAGTAVTTLNVATNETWKDNDGNTQERTEWHKVVLWGKLAKIAGQYLSKGSRLYVEGSLRTRSWEDQDGLKKYTTEIIAQTLTLLDTKSETSMSEAPTNDEVPQPEESDSKEPESAS